MLDCDPSTPLARSLERSERANTKGETIGEVRPKSANALKRLDANGCLIYKTLILTGLRKNELAVLDGRSACGLTASRRRSNCTRRTKKTGAVRRSPFATTLPPSSRMADGQTGGPSPRSPSKGRAGPYVACRGLDLVRVPNGLSRFLERRHEARRDSETRRSRSVSSMFTRCRMTFGSSWQRRAFRFGPRRNSCGIRPEIDGQRVYRSALARQGRSDRPFTRVTNRPWKRVPRVRTRLENRYLRHAKRCTNGCTKSCRKGSIRVSFCPFVQRCSRLHHEKAGLHGYATTGIGDVVCPSPSLRDYLKNQCRRQDLNLHPLVSGPAPQAGASANSATPARMVELDFRKLCRDCQESVEFQDATRSNFKMRRARSFPKVEFFRGPHAFFRMTPLVG